MSTTTDLVIDSSELTSNLTQVQDTSGNDSALWISTQNVRVGQSGDALPLLAVIGSPLSSQDDVGPHIMFGEPIATPNQPSASLTFAGWNISHCGFSWNPSAGQLNLAFGGRDNPENNPTGFTFQANGVLVMPLLPNLPAGGVADLVIDSSGQVSVSTSSARFKENIEPLEDDFHRILALTPRSFTYRDSGAPAIGYLAEEVDELELRRLVGYDADGKPLNIDYKMVPVYLLEVVKEQQRAIGELREEIRQLSGSSHDACDQAPVQ